MSSALVIGLLLLAATGAPDARINCRQGFEGLRKEAAILPGVKRSKEGGFEIYDATKTTGYVYFFTTSRHYAHQSVVRRHIFEQDGQVMVATDGCGFREKGPFMALMREMQGQTDALRDSMTSKTTPPASEVKP